MSGVIYLQNPPDGSVTTAKIVDRNVTPAKLSQPFTFGVPASASGVTAIDLTGIPSWANLILASFYQISLNGSAAIRIQLGTSGGAVTTGYAASSLNAGNGASPTVGNHTNGLVLNTATAANLHSGNMVLTRNTGNTWVASLNAGLSNNANSLLSVGGIALADALTQIRFVSSNGTDTFDGGTISLMFL